ncbi:hypothetical protein BGZ93_004387, partial [Podila epicladia]
MDDMMESSNLEDPSTTEEEEEEPEADNGTQSTLAPQPAPMPPPIIPYTPRQQRIETPQQRHQRKQQYVNNQVPYHS